MKMLRRFALIVSSYTILIATPSIVLASPLQAFVDACEHTPGERLPPDQVLGVLMNVANVPWSPEVVNTYQHTLEGRPGATFMSGTLSADIREELSNAVLDLAERGPGQPFEGIMITVSPSVDMDVADAYLSGNFSVLTISCPARTDPEPVSAPPLSRILPRSIVIAGDVSDLAAPFADRTFATLSYVEDREAGSSSIDTDIVIGFEPFEARSAQWILFTEYQRQTRTSAEVNDLTFGLLGVWTGGGHRVSWAGAYETDDEFESRAFRANIEWELPSISFCRDGTDFDQYLTCRFSLAADYAAIDDPGFKSTLMGIDDYLRLGARTRIAYGRALAGGTVRATFEYQLMEPVSGDYGDAAVGRLSLDYIPGDTANYSFGLSYEEGEDITSLVRSEVLKVVLGVRY